MLRTPATRRRMSRDPTEAPVLYYGCGRPALLDVSGIARNPGRSYLHCPFCHSWIWKDLLDYYAEDMVFFCHSTIQALQDELKSCHLSIQSKDRQIQSMEAELMKNSEIFQFDLPEAHGAVAQNTRRVWKLCLGLMDSAVLCWLLTTQ